MQKIYQVDAFTDKPFTGNPAAVCVFKEHKPDTLLQNIAREMNLSETAFLWPEAEGFKIRWFTPSHEEELCGHATLAAAHVLWEQGYLNPEQQAFFSSKSGSLAAVKRIDGAISMDFPAEPAKKTEAPAGLLKALNLRPSEVLFVGKNRLDYLLELESEQHVRTIKVDFSSLGAVAQHTPFRGIIVTAKGSGGVALTEGVGKNKRADRQFDCVSRFFTPEPAVPEDPVTGSAHCCIGPYWAAKLDCNKLLAFQASDRGGVIGIVIKGRAKEIQAGEIDHSTPAGQNQAATVSEEASGGRIELVGKAVTIMEGKLKI